MTAAWDNAISAMPDGPFVRAIGQAVANDASPAGGPTRWRARRIKNGGSMSEMMNWQPIESAPKDGRCIVVMYEDVGSFVMAWNRNATNHIFAPDQMGMWEAPDRSMTWETAECGPSHWKPLEKP